MIFSFPVMEILGQTSVNFMTLTCVSWSEGHHDLHFTVQWFCHISWRLLDGWTSTFDLKINVGHSDLYFTVYWFCLTSWRLDGWASYFRIIKLCGPTFDLKLNTGQHDLYFTVQWFCLMSWRLFDGWTSYFRIMRQCHASFEFIINKYRSQCDLFFMV